MCKERLSGSPERKTRIRIGTQSVRIWPNRHKHTMSKTRECCTNENGAGLRRIFGSEIHTLPIDDKGNAGVTEGRYCPAFPTLRKMFVSDLLE